MVKRSGPKIGDNINKPTNAFSSLIDKNVFKIRNSAIITPKDMSITLSPEEIKDVEREFRKVNKKAKTVPDRAYRSKMDETTGILVIYFMDLQKVFNVNHKESDKRLMEYSKNNGLDALNNKPLIGYAIGFPTVTGIDGGRFVSQHVFKEPEDMTFNELKEYIEVRDFDIDFENTKWTRAELLAVIQDLEDDVEGDEIPDDIDN